MQIDVDWKKGWRRRRAPSGGAVVKVQGVCLISRGDGRGAKGWLGKDDEVDDDWLVPYRMRRQEGCERSMYIE